MEPVPMLCEIRALPYFFVPRGWASCDGQLLPIAQYSAVYSILGTVYGGSEESGHFALPDLRESVPMGTGHGEGLSVRELGERGGAEKVALTEAHLPPHRHDVKASRFPGNEGRPSGTVSLARTVGATPYLPAGNNPPLTPMAAEAIDESGYGAPHDNMMPYLVVRFCIALVGFYPSRG